MVSGNIEYISFTKPTCVITSSSRIRRSTIWILIRVLRLPLCVCLCAIVFFSVRTTNMNQNDLDLVCVFFLNFKIEILAHFSLPTKPLHSIPLPNTQPPSSAMLRATCANARVVKCCTKRAVENLKINFIHKVSCFLVSAHKHAWVFEVCIKHIHIFAPFANNIFFGFAAATCVLYRDEENISVCPVARSMRSQFHLVTNEHFCFFFLVSSQIVRVRVRESHSKQVMLLMFAC